MKIVKLSHNYVSLLPCLGVEDERSDVVVVLIGCVVRRKSYTGTTTTVYRTDSIEYLRTVELGVGLERKDG